MHVSNVYDKNDDDNLDKIVMPASNTLEFHLHGLYQPFIWN